MCAEPARARLAHAPDGQQRALAVRPEGRDLAGRALLHHHVRRAARLARDAVAQREDRPEEIGGVARRALARGRARGGRGVVAAVAGAAGRVRGLLAEIAQHEGAAAAGRLCVLGHLRQPRLRVAAALLDRPGVDRRVGVERAQPQPVRLGETRGAQRGERERPALAARRLLAVRVPPRSRRTRPTPSPAPSPPSRPPPQALSGASGGVTALRKLECLAIASSWAAMQWLYAGEIPSRLGRSAYQPCGVFEARDGPVYAIVVTQDQWERLVRAMGEPEWARWEVFAEPQGRLDAADVLRERSPGGSPDARARSSSASRCATASRSPSPTPPRRRRRSSGGSPARPATRSGSTARRRGRRRLLRRRRPRRAIPAGHWRERSCSTSAPSGRALRRPAARPARRARDQGGVAPPSRRRPPASRLPRPARRGPRRPRPLRRLSRGQPRQGERRAGPDRARGPRPAAPPRRAGRRAALQPHARRGPRAAASAWTRRRSGSTTRGS